jgi:Na+-driven multidrug efflux pump
MANIVLDAIFIFDFHWGIGGAAFATVLSATLSSAILLSGYISGGSIARPSMKDLIPKVSLCVETISIGVSSFARLVSASLVGLFVNNAILIHGGPYHLSLLSMIYRVMILASIPVYAIGHGIQPIVGFNYGASNKARVREAIMASLLWSGSIALILWAIMVAFAKPILDMFSSFNQLAVRGVPMLRIIIFVFPLIIFRTIGSSLFQALGKPMQALMTNVSNQLLFIPLVVVLPLFAGLPGIWLSYPLADFLSFVVVYVLISLELRRVGMFKPVVTQAE